MDLSSVEILHPRFDEELRLLTLDLDHGKANEVGTRQLEAFAALCDLVEGSEEITCVCTASRRISKKGKPIFIAGADVTERSEWDDTRVKEHVVRQRETMRRLSRLPVFTIALSHGVTLGWGTEFLLTADYTLATSTASFALPETGLGILPGARGTAELANRVGPAQALRLGCTGESVNAVEALRIGLVQELVDDVDAGLDRVRTLALACRTRSPLAVAAFKRGMLDAIGQPEAARIEIERRAYERCVDSGEAAIGRASFAAIRAGDTPQWGKRE